VAEQPGVEDVGGEHGHAGIAEELHAGLVVALIAGEEGDAAVAGRGDAGVDEGLLPLAGLFAGEGLARIEREDEGVGLLGECGGGGQVEDAGLAGAGAGADDDMALGQGVCEGECLVAVERAAGQQAGGGLGEERGELVAGGEGGRAARERERGLVLPAQLGEKRRVGGGQVDQGGAAAELEVGGGGGGGVNHAPTLEGPAPTLTSSEVRGGTRQPSVRRSRGRRRPQWPLAGSAAARARPPGSFSRKVRRSLRRLGRSSAS